MTLSQYLSTLETARGNRKAAMNNLDCAKRDYIQAFTPLVDFPTDELLASIYEDCKGNGCYGRSDLFICVCLLLFNPEGLYDGKIKIKLAKAMSKVLGVNHTNVYIIRKKISLWMTLYPSFYQAVEVIYNKVVK